ncbi:hypothetical protein SAMN05421805_101679 [Saccharopolyspora antimicrobica]|uniref:Uncharacterized protein n=1 Tax=Saccharopolyspora antimicrobica TaxID=455193 RepID=A0A1I4RT15_9PSEU|nr:hypothetical protein ATL45_6313 [Saccharopolyspora antimicrobica]SFM55318.1 hypothetical protein SAMN05421805_101679 [Saccharopolyspora antimicrobica]
MGVPAISWSATGILLVLVAWDLTAAGRAGPLRRCTLLLVAQLLVAALVGAMLLGTSGSDVATQFFTGWATSLAATVDLLAVLLSVAAGMETVAVVVVVGVLARGALAFADAPLVGVVSVVFGAAVLWAAWRAFRGEGDPPRPLAPRLATAAVVLAALVLALLSAAATREVTGSAPLVLLAGVLALVGFRHVFGLLRGLLARVPDASVGLAVVLVFIGVKSVLAGLSGVGPAHDARVVLLTLGMVGAVAALGAITAARRAAR